MLLRQNTSGRKFYHNRFENKGRICAAGLSNLKNDSVASTLPCYLLQDHVNALLRDSILPEKPFKLPHLKPKEKRDMRNAGIFNEASDLINPPVKSKVQTLVEDFKNTLYDSYWKKEVGKCSDPKPRLPDGLNIYTTTMGKKYPIGPSAYDVIFPSHPINDQVPRSKRCGHQTKRNYCSFDENCTFGMKTNAGSSSKLVKSCLTDIKTETGNNLKKPVAIIQANFTERHISQLGLSLEPNHNISCVPEGFAFGKVESRDSIGVAECLTTCDINPDRNLLKKCLEHLNTIRKCMSKRFDGSFYAQFYLQLKYLDSGRTGSLPPDIIYHQCKIKYIQFDKKILEPLLIMWNIYDGYKIQYKAFVRILNYREPLPDLPKINDFPSEYLDFRTTYTEMTKRKQDTSLKYMAGVPSGRYFDKDYPVTPEGCCKADRSYLPEESDAKSCLCPSIFTLIGVSHRDMFANRDAKTVRKVFERAGEKFTDESFDAIWNEAKKYHSQGWVCFETFRRSLENYSNFHSK